MFPFFILFFFSLHISIWYGTLMKKCFNDWSQSMVTLVRLIHSLSFIPLLMMVSGLFLFFWRNYWFPILFGNQVSLMKRAGGFFNCKCWHVGVFFCVSRSQCLALVCDMWLWHSLVIHTYCWGLAICLFLELYLKPKVTLHFEQPNISLLFFILTNLNIAMSCWYLTKQNSRKTTSVN